MTHQDSDASGLREDIAKGLPWAQGQQVKGIRPVVGAIIEQQRVMS